MSTIQKDLLPGQRPICEYIINLTNKRYSMQYFKVQSITQFGRLEKMEEMGVHQQLVKMKPTKLDYQAPNDHLFTVIAEYEHFINGAIKSKLEITTVYLLGGLDKSNMEREYKFLTTLIIKSFSFLQAILAIKAQEINQHINIPDDPDYSESFNKVFQILSALPK